MENKAVSISDYFRIQGIVEFQKLSHRVLGNILKRMFAISDHAVGRLCKHFSEVKESSLIPMQRVIKEIDQFDFKVIPKEYLKLDMKIRATNAIIRIEETSGKNIQEIFSNIELNENGNLQISSIKNVLNKEIDEQIIDLVLAPLLEKGKIEVTVDELQQYLIEFSPMKEPSVDLELSLMNYDIKKSGMTEKDYLGVKSNNMEIDEFRLLIESKFNVNEIVSDMIINELKNDGKIDLNDFIKLLNTHTEPYSIRITQKNLSIKVVVKELEKTNNLIDLLEFTTFNEKSFMPKESLISALEKLYPKIEPEYKGFIYNQLDIGKKGFIKLYDIIDFIEQTSRKSIYPNIQIICKEILKVQSDVDGNMIMTVNKFIEHFGAKVKKKDLYYV